MSEPSTRGVTELGAPPSVLRSLVRSLGVGRRRSADLPTQQLVVRDHPTDAARLATYQRLCGFAVSSHLPSSFVHVRAFPLAIAVMGDPAFPFPLLGLIHVGNVMTQFRPIDSSEPLTVQMHAADLRDHSAGEQVDLVGAAHVGGELVWTGVATYLHRHAPPQADGAVKLRAAPHVPIPTARWRLAADVGRRYAAVSGDRNPIHLSVLSARAFGFRRTIAHGMYLHARALAAVESRLPDAYVVDAAFKTPVLLPSTVAFESIPSADGWQLRVGAADTGRPHFAATLTAGVGR